MVDCLGSGSLGRMSVDDLVVNEALWFAWAFDRFFRAEFEYDLFPFVDVGVFVPSWTSWCEDEQCEFIPFAVVTER